MNDLALQDARSVLENRINIPPMLEMAHEYTISCEVTAKNALSMSLQARKIKNALDECRSDVVKPHVNFQRAVNKMAKDIEKKLEDIENILKVKLQVWLDSQAKDDFCSIMTSKIEVEDGSLVNKTIWEWEILDESLIPRHLLEINTKAIEEMVKNGCRNIPGISIKEKKSISMRVKN